MNKIKNKKIYLLYGIIIFLLLPNLSNAARCDCYYTQNGSYCEIPGCGVSTNPVDLGGKSSCTVFGNGAAIGNSPSCSSGYIDSCSGAIYDPPYFTYCKNNACPNTTSYNGEICSINRLQTITCYLGEVTGKWDSLNDGPKCVKCSGNIESGIYGDTSTIYWNGSTYAVGDGKCESACGASSVCDEYSGPAWWLSGGGTTCNWCTGPTGCTSGSDSNQPATYYQSGSTCYYNCTVGCDYSPGGWERSGCGSCTLSDSCTANTMTVGGTCSSSGCSTGGTTYTCSSVSHTECQRVSCGGTYYHCENNGGNWQWGTEAFNPDRCGGNLDSSCYAYGTGCENRDYDCLTGGSSCTYASSNQHTDACNAGLNRDYYCSGSCTYTDSCVDPGGCCDTYWGNTAAYCSGGICYGPPTCTRQNPSVTISPSSQPATAGTALSYTVTVLNFDSSCGSETFSLTVPTCPSGWTCSLTSSSLTIGSGSSGSTNITVTSPVGASAASYTFTVRATNSGAPSYYGDGSGTYVVTSGCTRANPTTSISPASQSATAGTALSYTVNVTNNDSSCGSETFSLTVPTCPSGWTCSLTSSSLTIGSGSSGSTNITVTSPAGASAASYTFTVRATNSGATSYYGDGSGTYVVTTIITGCTLKDVKTDGIVDNGIPFLGVNYDAMRFQTLYLQSEIAQSGTIDKIYFYKTAASSAATFNNFRIYLCHSTLSVLGTTFASNCSDTPVLVKNSSSYVLPDGTGWMEIEIDNTFTYNNTNNLIVEIRWNSDNLQNGLLRISSPGNRRVFASSDSATLGTVGNYAYDFRMRICPPCSEGMSCLIAGDKCCSGGQLYTCQAATPQTFLSSASDGYIFQAGDNYATVRTSPTGSVNTSGLTIGQVYYVTYRAYRGFIFFDTSAIPSGAVISGATLSLWGSSDLSATDFDIIIQNGSGYPNDPLAAGDYNYSYYSGSGGNTFNTTSWVNNAWNNITLNSTGLGWIQKGGKTKLALRGSGDVNGSTPTQAEYVRADSREDGDGFAPKLAVSFSSGYNVWTASTTCASGCCLNSISTGTCSGAGCDCCTGCNLNRTGDYMIDFPCVLDGANYLQTGNLSIVTGGSIQMNPSSSFRFNPGKQINLQGNSYIIISATAIINKQ